MRWVGSVRSSVRVAVAGALVLSGVVASSPVGLAAAASFEPLPAPQRIADTRPDGETVDDEFEAIGALPAGGLLELQVGGRAGVDEDAAAAVLNVTAVTPSAPGFLTVYPCDTDQPNSSNLNYTTGAIVANAVFAGLDGSGRTCIFSQSPVDIVVDVTGSFPAGAFEALEAPQRIADTRPDGETVDNITEAIGKMGPDRLLTVQVAGRAGVPEDATTAVLNVTVVNAEAPGFFTVYPCDQDRPNASNLNYLAGDVVANSVTAKLDPDGKVCVFTLSRADVVVDVTGTLPADAFSPLDAPLRLVESRSGPDAETVDGDVESNGYRRAGSTLQFPVASRAGIPEDASAVVFNVTVTEPQSPGFLTLHPRGSDRPNASNINFTTGQTVANTVVAPLGVDGMVCLFSHVDTEVIVDVAGFFTGPPPPSTGPGCPIEIRPGVHPVGEYQMPPGRYRVEGNGVCEIQRWNEDTFLGGQLGSTGNFSPGPLIIDVLPTDPFVNYRFDNCPTLTPYVSPDEPANATTFGVGDWVVGDDIAPGTYRHVREFGSVCTGIRLSSFIGNESAWIERFNDNQAPVVTLTIQPTDVGFLSGCPNWERIG